MLSKPALIGTLWRSKPLNIRIIGTMATRYWIRLEDNYGILDQADSLDIDAGDLEKFYNQVVRRCDKCGHELP